VSNLARAHAERAEAAYATWQQQPSDQNYTRIRTEVLMAGMWAGIASVPSEVTHVLVADDAPSAEAEADRQPEERSECYEVPALDGALVMEHVDDHLCGWKAMAKDDVKVIDSRCIKAYRVPLQPEKHEEDTLRKVYAELYKTGLREQAITDVINGMQNSGILFRERD